MTDLSESDLAVVVWMNPESPGRPQKRLLETLTSRESTAPLALPIRSLTLSLPNPIPATEDTLQERILTSSKEEPLIIPLTLARSHLGWTEFDIQTYE